jgi:hypothetical protein
MPEAANAATQNTLTSPPADNQCKKRPTSIPEAKRDQDTLKRLNIYRPPMPAGSQTIVSTLLYS